MKEVKERIFMLIKYNPQIIEKTIWMNASAKHFWFSPLKQVIIIFQCYYKKLANRQQLNPYQIKKMYCFKSTFCKLNKLHIVFRLTVLDNGQ